MSLINELQESSERDDVIVVLRKTKRLCAKLGRDDILQWVNNELNGYPNDIKDIPDYRNITSYPGYRLNHYISGGYMINGIVLLTEIIPSFKSFKTCLLRPISEIIDIISSIKGDIRYCELMNEDAATAFKEFFRKDNEELLQHAQFLLQKDSNEIRAIPDRIKDMVLDWACSLEISGVTGEGQSFTTKEKKNANNVIFNVSRSIVGQISDSGTNLLGDDNGTV